MFDDHWRICCLSQDSAGKRTIKAPYFEDQEILEKYQKIIFYQKTEEARRRKREGPQGSLTTRGRGPARDGTRRVWVRVEPPHTRTHLL
jgi:hypothetical protein